MNYEETIKYLYNSVPMFQKVGATAYKEGLANTLALDAHFQHPHRHFKTIHVAGTNGKGSCSHTIAAILQAAGYKTGLYTSPHIVDFRERIRVNGVCVSKKYVVDFVTKERSFFEPLHPSFFELTTAMAFCYFAQQHVDIAVIEVGLGGRLDCTNIIQPVLSVITNISFDHTQFLGNTLAKIASEKAGIIKLHTPVVIGEANKETKPVFDRKAQQEDSPIIYAEQVKEEISGHVCKTGGIDYETRDFGLYHGELGGSYQLKNTNTILVAVKQLQKNGFKISNQQVAEGFAHVSNMTGLVGRWQKIREKPTVICDTGHNIGGWQYLSQQLQVQKCQTMRIVFGMVDDKDIHTVMELLPSHAVYYYTKASTKRAINEEKIKAIGDSLGLQGKCFKNVKAAYQQALADAMPNDFIFVGGSSYIVADFMVE